MKYTATPDKDDPLVLILERIPGAMNIEEVDGFFTALICSPDMVMPSVYLPEILGESINEGSFFADEQEVKSFYMLLMELWNSSADVLYKGDIPPPILCQDDDGNVYGNDWALGFMRGVQLAGGAWHELLQDDDKGGLLLPMLILAHEHDPDPEYRPYGEEVVTPEMREKAIIGMVAAVPAIYNYFKEHRRLSRGVIQRSQPKTGRNDPCPCGSGKKYKKCCNDVVIH